MDNARDIRLQSDYQHLSALAENSGGTLVLESFRGRPPDEYVLVYNCRSVEALQNGKPVYRYQHRLKIRLPARYPIPSAPPQVEMLTPLFHPHVYPNHTVCLGHWQTSEFLDELALRLGSMLQYERHVLSIRDPANPEAVGWAQRNLILFPTDTCTFAGDTLKEHPAEEDAPVGWIDLM